MPKLAKGVQIWKRYCNSWSIAGGNVLHGELPELTIVLMARALLMSGFRRSPTA